MHCYWGVSNFVKFVNGTGPNRTRTHGIPLTFITMADAKVKYVMRYRIGKYD